MVTLLVLAFNLITWFMVVGHNYWGSFYWGLEPSSQVGIHEMVDQECGQYAFACKQQSGWDGQFYYYVSLDPLAKQESAWSVDAPKYRYGRIGQPLIAIVLSKLLLQKSVSPFLFVLSSVLAVSLACFFLASLYRKEGLSPYYALFWVLSLAVQSTFKHGMIDATSDALFILALVSFIYRRSGFYACAMTLCLLSRESFAVAALVLLALDRFHHWFKYSLPFLALALWKSFLWMRFGFPQVGGAGLIWRPFVGLFYAFSNLTRMSGINLYVQIVGLTFFCATLLFALVVFSRAVLKKQKYEYLPIITLILLYFCFTTAVLDLFVYYFRFLGVLIAFLPLALYQITERKNSKGLLLFLVLLTGFGLGGEFGSKYLRSMYSPLKMAPAEFLDIAEGPGETFPDAAVMNGELKILESKTRPYSQLPKLFSPRYDVLTCELTNLSDQIWKSQMQSHSLGLVLNKDFFERRYVDRSYYIQTK